jgi:hypothetical protein
MASLIQFDILREYLRDLEINQLFDFNSLEKEAISRVQSVIGKYNSHFLSGSIFLSYLEDFEKLTLVETLEDDGKNVFFKLKQHPPKELDVQNFTVLIMILSKKENTEIWRLWFMPFDEFFVYMRKKHKF